MIYIERQLKIGNPILNFRILISQKYALAAIIVGLNFAMIMAALYMIPQMLQIGLNLSVSLAGIILLPAWVVNACISLFSGHLYDSFGAKNLARIGSIICIIGIILLLGIKTNASVFYIIISETLLMCGSGLLLSPVQSYGLGDLSGANSNDGSTIMNTFQQIPGTLSVSVATTFLIIGGQSSSLTGQTRSIWLVLTLHFGG